MAAPDSLRGPASGFIPADDHIASNLHCPTCGYNLRGLDADGVCPECGAAIARAVELRRLADEIDVWPRLRGCAGFVGGASLVAAAGFAANAPTAGVGVPCIFPFVVTFVTPMGAIAGFFFHAAAVRVVGRAKPFSAVLIPGVCVIAAAWNAALHVALPPQPGIPFAGPGLLPATVAVCLLPALLALVLVVDAKACEILRLIRGHASAEMRYALVACCWLTTLVMIGSVIYARVWAIPIGSCFRAALICWTLTLGLFGVRMLRVRKAIAHGEAASRR